MEDWTEKENNRNLNDLDSFLLTPLEVKNFGSLIYVIDQQFVFYLVQSQNFALIMIGRIVFNQSYL